MAQTQSTKEAIWLRSIITQLLRENDSPQVTIIYGDNQGAIALAKNPQFHSSTKCLDNQTHLVREKQAEGKVDLRYNPTDKQFADGLTKALCKDHFITFRHPLGLESPDSST